MNYKKLADLLFPNITKTTEYYENLYPARALKEGQEVTRFAPSPTGYMHIGHFFGASMDYRLAKSTNGVFYFRLEDTDKKREVEGSDVVALNTLKTFNIVPDEGFTAERKNNGIYGPYRQSDRMEIYKTYIKKLISEGKAFPCFCDKPENKEEILEKRQNEIESSATIEDKDECRNLSYEQIEKFVKEGRPFAVRLKSNGEQDQKIKVKDRVRGERELGRNCKDVVILKSDGIPPYTFAHPIDDHLMHTTTVIRGEEWFATWPQHVEIHEALGFKLPKYIHTPVLCKIGDNGNKRKLSKRLDPEADMRFYIKEGIPTEGITEYIMNLLNSNFEIWRTQNPQKSIDEFPFSVLKIGTSSPMFDIVKLYDVCKTVISKFDENKFYDYTLAWANQFDRDFAEYLKNNEVYAKKVFAIDRNIAKPRKDIAKWSEVKEYFNYMFTDNYIKEFDEKFSQDTVKKVLEAYKKVYKQEDDKQEWFETMKSIANNLGFCADSKEYKANPEKYLGNISDIASIIRSAVTGRKNSPDLFEIMQILGYNKVIERLEL